MKNKTIGLQNEVNILFRNNHGKTKEITIKVRQLLEKTIDDFQEMLENNEPCVSSSCNNESQNFCDCPPLFEDFEIIGLTIKQEEKSKETETYPCPQCQGGGCPYCCGYGTIPK
jgi:hypothetical protein